MSTLPTLLEESPAIAERRDRVSRLLQTGAGARRLPPVLIQGKTGTSKGLLGEIEATVYGSFTEGFATIDLRDARSLLEELDASR